ncbi:unnamed protein product [Debaryomyces tyrocola]|nr:unnamed protein product [Debaryomyces tyrocola]
MESCDVDKNIHAPDYYEEDSTTQARQIRHGTAYDCTVLAIDTKYYLNTVAVVMAVLVTVIVVVVGVIAVVIVKLVT